MIESDFALRVDHAENEETPNSRKHDDRFEPEEVAELIWSEEGEGHVY